MNVQSNVTQIPKGKPSSSVAIYRPISITIVLSKVFERLVSVRLGRFMERSGVLPTTQFAYRKGLGTCGALLCLSDIRILSALEDRSAMRHIGLLLHCLLLHWQAARIVQIDFSAAFDSHQGILYKLCSVGIGGSVLNILTQFFYQTNHSTLW